MDKTIMKVSFRQLAMGEWLYLRPKATTQQFRINPSTFKITLEEVTRTVFPELISIEGPSEGIMGEFHKLMALAEGQDIHVYVREATWYPDLKGDLLKDGEIDYDRLDEIHNNMGGEIVFSACYVTVPEGQDQEGAREAGSLEYNNPWTLEYTDKMSLEDLPPFWTTMSGSLLPAWVK